MNFVKSNDIYLLLSSAFKKQQFGVFKHIFNSYNIEYEYKKNIGFIVSSSKRTKKTIIVSTFDKNLNHKYISNAFITTIAIFNMIHSSSNETTYVFTINNNHNKNIDEYKRAFGENQFIVDLNIDSKKIKKDPDIAKYTNAVNFLTDALDIDDHINIIYKISIDNILKNKSISDINKYINKKNKKERKVINRKTISSKNEDYLDAIIGLIEDLYVGKSKDLYLILERCIYLDYSFRKSDLIIATNKKFFKKLKKFKIIKKESSGMYTFSFDIFHSANFKGYMTLRELDFMEAILIYEFLTDIKSFKIKDFQNYISNCLGDDLDRDMEILDALLDSGVIKSKNTKEMKIL